MYQPVITPEIPNTIAVINTDVRLSSLKNAKINGAANSKDLKDLQQLIKDNPVKKEDEE